VTKTLIIQDSLFRNNTAGSHAGAVYTGSKIILDISNSIFADNAAYGTTGGGAVWASSDDVITVTTSNFERNRALAGAGGALLTFETELNLIDVNFTENFAATDGGAVRSNEQTVIYPRGTTRLDRNSARGNGGAISLDASSLKTNEASLIFAENEARLGGALSAINEASAFFSAGCRTVKFEMNWAQSSTLNYAENSNSVLLRRVRNNPTPRPTEMPTTATSTSATILPTSTGPSNQPTLPPSSPPTRATDMAISSEDIMDDRGEWTILIPPGSEDTSDRRVC
jgi:predicted outer membrane repeat protein